MFRKVLMTLGLLIVTSVMAFGQGTLRGTIVNAKTNQPEPFVNVIAKQNGEYRGGAATDVDGNYIIKPLAAGSYDIEASAMGFAPVTLAGVTVKASGSSYADTIKMESASKTMKEVKIVRSKVPLIDKGSPEGGQRMTDKDLARMPGSSIESAVATVAGVGYSDGGVGTARGQDEGMATYVGGMRKNSGVYVPKEAIAEIQVILSGTPARYGEAIGGAQVITLKPPAPKFNGLVRYETYLDYRLYNALTFYLTGPIIKSEATQTQAEKTLVGFRLTGVLDYQADPYYRRDGYRYQVVKDDVRKGIEETPIEYDPLTGAVNHTGEYLRASDFETVKRKDGMQSYTAYVEAGLDIRFSDYATLQVSADYKFARQPSTSSAAWPLAMSTYLGTYDYNNFSVMADFTQRFPDKKPAAGDATMPAAENTAAITKVMYNISGMFNKVWTKTYNADFGDDVFKYGHIGTFETKKTRTYGYGNFVVDGIEQVARIQENWMDTAVLFTPSEYNPLLARYTSQLYGMQEISSALINYNNIRAFNGLINGDSPNSIYGLMYNVGYNFSSYSKAMAEYIYLQAKVSADVKGHSLELGFQYDQRTTHSYSLAARSLWTIMRQSANAHILQLDLDNPIIDQSGQHVTVNYDRLYDEASQTYFDRAMREKLGLDVRGTDWLDVDSYDPNWFSLDMLSPDEMFNDGNPIVSYSGYDHKGNLLRGKQSLENFFNSPERKLGAFSPIYMAGYIQDQFEFEDLIFNVGVRVDRFDANQMVLKDPYLLYESYTVGELSGVNYDGVLPAGVGDDWVVYVDDPTSSTPTITGFRNGSTWYTADGVETADPYKLKGSSGKPTPFRKPDAQKAYNENTPSVSAFKDYEPQVVAMPRIAFSFPVSDKSLFKASYDIICNRPSGGWSADYVGYLFMTQQSVLNNPNLKPEKITNYELGFQQVLSESSAVTITAYYKETRNLIQLVQYNGADPNPNYYSYDNLDFKTVKGVSLAYDLRTTKNIRVNANYTLQYAEGTGLPSSTMQELIKEGYSTLKMLNPISDDRRHEFKLNLDYRFGPSEGPKITRSTVDKDGNERSKTLFPLQNFGVNIIAVAQSGRPYTKRFSNTQNTIVGSYNGARLPWGFYFDMVVDKKWTFNVNKRPTYLVLAVTVTNLFNIKNVVGVYSVTGNAEDDGYLTDPETQTVIESYLDSQSYRDMYTISLSNSNYLYSRPRLIKVGLTYRF